MRYRSLTFTWLLASAALAQYGPDALVETKRFHTPGGKDQVDVSISILGTSTTWAPNERGFQEAQVEAVTIVQRGTDIVDFRKTVVRAPERNDTLHNDFLHQERFELPPGDYALSVELRDLISGDTTRSIFQAPLLITERPSGLSFSDIELTTRSQPATGEAVTLPFAGTYYPGGTDKLGFYAEIYGSPASVGMDSLFLLTAQIESFETNEVVGAFKHVQRAKAAPVVPVSMEFGIAKLPSGNYQVAIEARDRTGKLLGKQTQFIQRNNPISYDLNALSAGDVSTTFVQAFTDPDTLAEHLASMRPIADELERKMIDDSGIDKDLEAMKRLMYTFWFNRNGYDPGGEWMRYKAKVDYVDRLFGCRNMRGYQSDQGYVYLRYGAPNTVVDRSNETSSIPYIIWHYYRARKYTNKRFIFWQPERSTTCWTLLHSEVPGEIKNPRWNQLLHQTDMPWGSSNSNPASLSGQEALDNFTNPR